MLPVEKLPPKLTWDGSTFSVGQWLCDDLGVAESGLADVIGIALYFCSHLVDRSWRTSCCGKLASSGVPVYEESRIVRSVGRRCWNSIVGAGM